MPSEEIHRLFDVNLTGAALVTREFLPGMIRAGGGHIVMMASIAGRIPMTLNGKGQPLDIGRRTRVVPAPMRRALLIRDRGCAFPGCDRDARWAHIRRQ